MKNLIRETCKVAYPYPSVVAYPSYRIFVSHFDVQRCNACSSILIRNGDTIQGFATGGCATVIRYGDTQQVDKQRPCDIDQPNGVPPSRGVYWLPAFRRASAHDMYLRYTVRSVGAHTVGCCVSLCKCTWSPAIISLNAHSRTRISTLYTGI